MILLVRLALPLVAVCLAGCMGAPYPTGRPAELVPGGSSVEAQVQGRRLHWVESGDADAPPVLFIHGTPGSWEAFADYLSAPALSGYRLIAVDRPGFGGSSAGGVEPALSAQAAYLAEAFAELPPMIVVGHSLGGSIAMQLVRDAPDRVAGVVLVAASLEPAAEAPRWFNRLANWPLVRRIVPDSLARANDEVLALEPELRALWAGWTPPETPVILIQGMEDSLVRPSTADFAESVLHSDSTVIQRVDHAGHFVLWEQPERVIDAIHTLAEP